MQIAPAVDYYRCKLCGYTSPTQVPPGRKVHHNCRSRGLGDTIARATSAVGIEPCGGCQDRQEWFNQVIRYRATLDVLFIVAPTMANSIGSKTTYQLQLLREAGLTADLSVGDLQPQDAVDLISDRRPRLLINRAFRIPPEYVDRLAQMYPELRIVTVCHSSQSDLMRASSWLQRQCQYLTIASQRPNCDYALVDERVDQWRPLFGDYQPAWLPNPLERIEASPRPATERPVVSLICAYRALKNIPNQILGFAEAARRRPLRLLVSNRRDKGAGLHPLADALGLDYVERP
jgi:hypothetical protein